MATGYTHALNQGEQSFEDFVFGCAKAFGAYIHLRDEPSSAVLSKIEDDSARYELAIGTAQTHYDDFTALTEEEQREKYDKYVAEMTHWNEETKKSNRELSERYGRMLARVISWDAPKELSELQEFMKEQLESSIRFDCRGGNYRIQEFDEWLDTKVRCLERAISSATERFEREKARVAEQHAWHDTLFKAVREA